MKKIILIVVGLTFIFISCRKNENDTNKISPNAMVIGKGLDCGNSYLIKFNDDFSGIPENSFDNTFYEINLPDEFKIDGKSVYIEFRDPKDEEIMGCTTMGPSYYQIFITKVE